MCSYLDQVGATYYFRRAVPKDLVGHFLTNTGRPRTEWKFSLGTKDRETAKRCLRPHEIETDALIDEARASLGSSERQSVGDQTADQRERERAQAAVALAEESRLRREARSQLRTLWHKRRRTSTAMLSPEEAAAVDLLKDQEAEIERLKSAVATMKAGNDKLGVQALAVSHSRTSPALSALFERYAKSGAANPKTVLKWRSAVRKLIAHLGHDDATKVTRVDLNGWITHLVAQGLAKKTIVDGYLPAARAVLSIAFEDGLIATNPASALRVRAPKPVKLRERDLTDAEAAIILKASLLPQSNRLSDDHALARRWVPWLCAYTGARVGEITQLRAMDIRQDGVIWYIHITPEADGGVKTNEARKVPLHSHLIEQGITELAKSEDTSPLFFREGTGSEANPGSKIRAAHLARWVRSLGIDAPQPFHGWRHRFKTMTRKVGLPDYLADKLQGHASPSQGARYGDGELLEVLSEAIERLPRYHV